MSIVGSGVVTLTSGMARCEVVPQVGGAIAGYWWDRDGARLDWLRPAGPSAAARRDARAMGCFPMVPYINRIRDGRFQFCGHEVVETAADPGMRHAIHGHGWRREWQVVERGEDRLVLEYAHTPDAWPWPYRARQSFVLSPDVLSLTLEIENLSDTLMPAGLGFHPFFPRTAGTRLSAAARGVWRTDAERLPTEWTGVPAAWDCASGRAVDELELDNIFTGWDGKAVIAWPERRAQLVVDAEQPILSFLTLYTPPGADFFCVEPVSHCADAVNLARSGIADTGIRVLAPGALRGATVMLRPQLL
jgi:aldose 1-epimerase